jgi:nitrite reductase/ring-hydroxylating ferredoxin subunit
MDVTYELFPAEELEPGQMRAIRVAGIDVVVARLDDGRFRALKNRCSHLGAPLVHGRLEHMVETDEAGRHRLSETFIIRCPWHGFEFDVETGRCPADPQGTRVASYTVYVEDGLVMLKR